MDTKNIIQEHSQEKLTVFKSYLINYLSVMINVSFVKKIYVWDIFAGMGKDDNGNIGSALIAADIVKNFQDKGKEIYLTVNELDKKRFQKLKENLSGYKKDKYIGFRNYTAEELINKINSKKINKSHHFFFLDPHGYTQCDSNALLKLLSMKQADHLIFMPISHIYRFIKSKNTSARKFVEDLGVDTSNIKRQSELITRIERSLKDRIQKSYIYSYQITNKEKVSSIYALFFITKNITGAAKFLEVKQKIMTEVSTQGMLFDFVGQDVKDLLLDYLQEYRTNTEVYQHLIEHGYLAKEATTVLKSLKDSAQLVVEYCLGTTYGYHLNSKEDKLRLKVK